MNGQKQKRSEGKKKASKLSWWFLAVVLVIYLIAAFIDPATAAKAVSVFSGIIMQVAPVLVLVFFLLFLVDLFIDQKKAARYLGRESGITGWFFAVAGGILSSGPIYVWFPFLAEMREKGMKTELAATFLYNRAVKLPLLPLMIYYFGLAFTVVLTIYMILFSVLAGYLTGLAVGPQGEKEEKNA